MISDNDNNDTIDWDSFSAKAGFSQDFVIGTVPGAKPDPNAIPEASLSNDALSPEDFRVKRRAADIGYAGFTHEYVDQLEVLAAFKAGVLRAQQKVRDALQKGYGGST